MGKTPVTNRSLCSLPSGGRGSPYRLFLPQGLPRDRERSSRHWSGEPLWEPMRLRLSARESSAPSSPKGGPRIESPIWPPTICRSREQEARATDCLLASFTEDPSGEEARRFALVIIKTGARVFWADAPAKANLQPLTPLRSKG